MSTEEMNIQELESQFNEQEALRREKLLELQREGKDPFDVYKVDWFKLINSTPICVSLGIDAILFFAFLIFIKPFEFLQFKAFASAGFFTYLAYCANADSWLAYTIPLYYVLLGLLTRRLGIFLGIVLALASLGMLGFIIWQKMA